MGEIPSKGLAPLVTIHPWSVESVGAGILSSGGVALVSTSSFAWPGFQVAIFVPFVLSVPFTVVKMFVYNGATVSGNLDVGIYFNEGGSAGLLSKIVSKGSTAQSGASAIQTLDIADTQLAPGSYYMVLAVDNTTATVYRSLVNWAAFRAMGGRAVSLDGWPLSDPEDMAAEASYGYAPVFGLTGRTVV